MIELFFSAFFVVVILYLSVKSDINSKSTILVLAISTFFYAVSGPMYWLLEKDANFLGLDWKDQIGPASLVLSFASLILSYFIKIFTTAKFNMSAQQDKYETSFRLLRVLYFISIISGIYVLVMSYIYGVVNNNNSPFFLIAYQFSDILIPITLYKISVSKSFNHKLLLILAYAIFALSVGFRYKLALFLGPIALYYFIAGVRKNPTIFNNITSLLKFGIFGLLIVSSLSFLTLIRKPFAGVDISGVGDLDSEDFLYGIFAESNTIFALSTIITEFVNKSNFYFLVPIQDALLELLPRFIYPERITGAYLADVLAKMYVPEAMESGTAYPYVGELLLIGGWVALPVGLILIAIWYSWCVRKLSVAKVSFETTNMGLALLAVYFGYYFYSRGYFAQSFKGFLFIVLPYLMLCRSSRISEKK